MRCTYTPIIAINDNISLNIIGDINFGWISEQIVSMIKDLKSCSYEVFYRQWYQFTLSLNYELPVKRHKIILLYYNLAVPLIVISECIKNNCMRKINSFQAIMNDIMLYPRIRYKLDPNQNESFYPYDDNSSLLEQSSIIEDFHTIYMKFIWSKILLDRFNPNLCDDIIIRLFNFISIDYIDKFIHLNNKFILV